MDDSPIMRGATVPESEELLITPPSPPLGVVLVEPRIPPNVGATSRICAAIGSPLHLVGRQSFREDHPKRRRAGLDYWPLVDKVYHSDFEAFLSAEPGARLHLFSTTAGQSLWDRRFAAGDFLVFGSEDDGLPEALLRARPEAAVRIPMRPGIRSLNLTNSVAVAAFEAMRQLAVLSPDDG